jgi:hypothetical protein
LSLHQIFLFLHFLSIAVVMGVGVANIVSFRVSRNSTGDVAKGVAKAREATLIYSDIFVTLLVLAGLGLLWDRGGMAGLSVWFHIKMAAVVIWLVSFITMRLIIARYLKSRDAALMPRIRMLAHVAITGAAVAMFCAVMAFAG